MSDFTTKNQSKAASSEARPAQQTNGVAKLRQQTQHQPLSITAQSPTMGTSLQGITNITMRLSHHLKAAQSQQKNKRARPKPAPATVYQDQFGLTKCTTTQYSKLRSASNLRKPPRHALMLDDLD
ncbi:hypothetical protein Nepgr_026664 [Nepenthes gracilis]|uniref:Uncharacterized protein n=1 Tax=Nepenthes gracilis TaxID=150966 RepID=A0AAD3T8Y3_NEPGR|nr:hypothetical protein Nepgr_026664 [Nepenthes gracilis]